MGAGKKRGRAGELEVGRREERGDAWAQEGGEKRVGDESEVKMRLIEGCVKRGPLARRKSRKARGHRPRGEMAQITR